MSNKKLFDLILGIETRSLLVESMTFFNNKCAVNAEWQSYKEDFKFDKTSANLSSPVMVLKTLM